MKLPKDLREFVALLNARGAKYVIVGGYAVAYHGYPRYTGDIDIFIDLSHLNANAVFNALSDFGFESLGLKASDLEEPDCVIQLGYPPSRIDLITTIDGVSFDEAWATRVQDQLEDQPVAFISKSLLIQNKRATGRAQDIADIEALAE